MNEHDSSEKEEDNLCALSQFTKVTRCCYYAKI